MYEPLLWQLKQWGAQFENIEIIIIINVYYWFVGTNGQWTSKVDQISYKILHIPDKIILASCSLGNIFLPVSNSNVESEL